MVKNTDRSTDREGKDNPLNRVDIELGESDSDLHLKAL